MSASTQHGTQIFIAGWGFVCLQESSQNNFFIPGYGFMNDINNYQSSSTTPSLIGYP